jgi:hypothetical protein
VVKIASRLAAKNNRFFDGKKLPFLTLSDLKKIKNAYQLIAFN